MGTSTDAILAYGFKVEESWSPLAEDVEDNGEPSMYKSVELYNICYRGKSGDVTLVQHCSDECPMWLLVLTSSVLKANRGYPIPVDRLSDYKDVRLIEFAKQHSIPIEGKAGWLLCSYWG